MNILVILLAGVTAFLAGLVSGYVCKGKNAFYNDYGYSCKRTAPACVNKEYLNFLNYDGTEQV